MVEQLCGSSIDPRMSLVARATKCMECVRVSAAFNWSSSFECAFKFAMFLSAKLRKGSKNMFWDGQCLVSLRVGQGKLEAFWWCAFYRQQLKHRMSDGVKVWLTKIPLQKWTQDSEQEDMYKYQNKKKRKTKKLVMNFGSPDPVIHVYCITTIS